MESSKKDQAYDTWNEGAGSRRWKLPSRPTVRRGGKLLLDGALAAMAWALACALLHRALPTARGTALFTALALAVNAAFGFTSQHYRMVGFTEAWALLRGSLAITAAALVFCALNGASRFRVEGADICCSAGLLTGAMWFGFRVLAMRLHRRRFTAQPEPAGGWPRAERTLIVGAGRAGMRLCQELREHPRLNYQVLGFVDDALEKQGVRIEGVPVLGPTRLLQTFVREQEATLVILGMAGAPGAKIRELSQRLQATGIRVKTVPGILDLVGDHPWKPEVRDIAIEDLLRREAVNLDTGPIRHALDGSVALITGAGGSIGSELCRRVASFRPGCLVLLGRGENSLWEIERDLRRLYPDQVLAVALCDIRNRARLHQVFDAWRPQVVFHAAAHKHVPYLEQHPEEGIENNIFGTQNVLKAALAAAARIVVNVSTDKAVNPVNVLGVTKRIGEHLVIQAAAQAPKGSRYVSVRFGNVLGSRGSVIPLFRDQIRRGGPITVTHPDMVRYFMTIPEAGQLVLQAGILGGTGRVFALDMGEPVHIVDLARDMARLSGLSPGVDIDIQFTGARPGEKFFEELFTEVEDRKAYVHPKIFEAVQDPRDPALMEQGLAALRMAPGLPEGVRQREMLRWLMKLVPVYRPAPSGMGRFLQEETRPRSRAAQEGPLGVPG
ncbi:MAG: nucleoside-diphosphate sugar epimerase/dehydratase [Holophaga sp.]|nr:nucleoside-diphosphate sugar epimerase/dehydratase [Holophaga sp.]